MAHIGAKARIAVSIVSGSLIGFAFASDPVRAEPPIRSPEDAACRLEARAKVFSTPNPHGLELEQIGRQIYFACMSRLGQANAQAGKNPGRRRGHRHRRR
ncbi:hypothetical protein ACLBX9_23260 [Methylobacterium sp. A49B]